MFEELPEATEDAESPPADSKRPGAGAERQEADEIRSGELRRGLGEKARGGRHLPDIEQYVVESECVGRNEGEKVKMEKHLPDT